MLSYIHSLTFDQVMLISWAGLVIVILLLIILFVICQRQSQKHTEAIQSYTAQADEKIREQTESLRHEFIVTSEATKSTQNSQHLQFLSLLSQSNSELNRRFHELEESLLQRSENQQMIQEKRLETLSTGLKETIESMRSSMNAQLTDIRSANEKSLSEMRTTVEEKLQETLNTRITASFKAVETQLTAVYQGLGEMRQMAQNVDGLRRVLTNVKTRGTFGEMQLSLILAEVLTPDQYATNVQTRPGTSERVEFAIRLPGHDGTGSVWLPIDAKFPLEDYERLLQASDTCDYAAQAVALKGIEDRILLEAKKIHDKYVEVPYTTEFAILYLPVESLWAEVLKRPGLIDRIHRDYHITVAGPTVLAALLNSLQMGFRTLAIEKRSAEVWQILGQVKSEFSKFSDSIDSVDKKLDQLKSTIDSVRTRTNVMNRKLKSVEVVELSSTHTHPEQTTFLE